MKWSQISHKFNVQIAVFCSTSYSLFPDFSALISLVLAALTILIFPPSCPTPKNAGASLWWPFSWVQFPSAAQVQFCSNRFHSLWVDSVSLDWQAPIIEKVEAVDSNWVSLSILFAAPHPLFGTLCQSNTFFSLVAFDCSVCFFISQTTFLLTSFFPSCNLFSNAFNFSSHRHFHYFKKVTTC